MNNNIFALYNQFRQNPLGMINQRYHLSEGVDTNNPDAILQDLLNTKQVTQEQINHISSMRNNPIIQMLLRR